MKKSLSFRKFALTTRLSSKKLIKQLSAISINSTQSVDANAKSSSPEESPKKKTVQFNEGDNEWYYAEDKNGDAIELTPKDMQRIWYSGREVHTFREEALRMAAKWAKQDSSNNAPSAMAKTLTRAYETSNANQTTRLLKDLYMPAHHVVGLEQWIVRKKCADERKEAVLDAVMTIQDASFSDESVRADKMRSASRAHSKASACFAAQMALKASREDE